MTSGRALVTGGAGFIGSNLVAGLLARGYDVTVLDNLSSGHRRNLAPSPRLRFLLGDVRNPTDLDQAIEGADTVFHLAASVGNKRSIDDPVSDADVNVLGTVRMLEAARRAGVTKIVAASSAGIFGELKLLPIREDHPVEPDSPYGSTKLCGEKLCLAYGKLYDISVTCLRYFNVYGPLQRFDAYGNAIPIFACRALRGEPVQVYGDGNQTRDFVYVSDVVAANILAAESPGARGPFNIGSGSQVTINALLEDLGEVIGRRLTIEHVEPRPGDVRHSRADISAAAAAFGFAPAMPLQAGLGQYVDWLRETGEFQAAAR